MRHLIFARPRSLLLLFGGAVPAAAQSPGGMMNQGQGTSREKFKPQPVAGAQHDAGAPQRAEATPHPRSTASRQQGSDSMSTKSLPDEATAQAPQTKVFCSWHLPDRVLLIDPDNKAVVEIVADHTTTV